MNKEKVVKVWFDFTEKNDFKLNPDKKHVEIILNGVLKNEKKFGLKLCPCRVSKEKKDLELICPCNFKIHETWKTKGMCWCGLFVKR